MKNWCAKRDGLKCMYCGLPAQFPGELVLHHVDHRVFNSYSDNVQLYHADCNVDERWGRPSRRLTGRDPLLCTPAPKKDTAELLLPETGEILADERTTPSQATNIYNETEYRRACFKATLDMYDSSITDADKYMSRRQMMSYAMEVSGASQDAAYGYNRRLFAPRVGPLLVLPELDGKIKTVRFRDPKDYKLTIEQLMRKYPKEGQAYAS
jgi:hypothetical protein